MKLSGSSKHAKHIAQKKALESAELNNAEELASEAADFRELTEEEINKVVSEIPEADMELPELDVEYEREYEQAKALVNSMEENEPEPAEEPESVEGTEEAEEAPAADDGGEGGDNGGSDGGDDDGGNAEEPDDEDGEEEKLSPEEIEAAIAAYQKVKRKKRKKRLIIALSVIAALIIGGIVAWKIIVRPPKVNENAGPITYNNSQSTDTSSSNAEGEKSNTENNTPQTTQSAENTNEQEEEPATGRKKNVVTFLVVGNDNGYGNTDTIMVGMLDYGNNKLSVVSIPRDTMVNVSWEVKKVNTIYTFANGIDGLKRGIAELTGYEVDSYFVVDLNAFVVLVDTIGGVDYYVPQDMNYDAPDQNLYIHFKEGMQHLNGEDALKVVRFRTGYAGGDIDRIKTQQGFLRAVAKKCLSIKSLFKIDDFADIFKEYVDTDLTTGNIIWFAQQLMNLGEDDITFITLPENYNDSVKGLSYCTIYLDEWLEVINQYINPFNVEITAENLNVITRDSNRNLYATTGAIAGGIGSFYDWYAHFGSTANEEPQTVQETTPPATTQTTETPEPVATTPETGTEPETGGETETPPEAGGKTEEPGEGEQQPAEPETPLVESSEEPGGAEETQPAPEEPPEQTQPEGQG